MEGIVVTSHLGRWLWNDMEIISVHWREKWMSLKVTVENAAPLLTIYTSFPVRQRRFAHGQSVEQRTRSLFVRREVVLVISSDTTQYRKHERSVATESPCAVDRYHRREAGGQSHGYDTYAGSSLGGQTV